MTSLASIDEQIYEAASRVVAYHLEGYEVPSNAWDQLARMCSRRESFLARETSSRKGTPDANP